MAKSGKGGGEGKTLRASPSGMAVFGGATDRPLAPLLRRAGIEIADAEPPPAEIRPALAARYGFGRASARTGPMGHLREVRQVLDAAISGWRPQHGFWQQTDGGWVDGLRPGIDPAGLPDLTTAEAYRAGHLAALRRLITTTPLWIIGLSTLTGLVDPADGTVYPEPPDGIRPPPGAGLVRRASQPDALDADFAALHATLKQQNPALRLRIVICADPASEEGATLRRHAITWSRQFADVASDPVFDHLVDRLAGLPDNSLDAPRLGAVLLGLAQGGDLLDLLSQGPQTTATSPKTDTADRAARRERRRKRAERRETERSPSVVCEDELLEAFS